MGPENRKAETLDYASLQKKGKEPPPVIPRRSIRMMWVFLIVGIVTFLITQNIPTITWRLPAAGQRFYIPNPSIYGYCFYLSLFSPLIFLLISAKLFSYKRQWKGTIVCLMMAFSGLSILGGAVSISYHKPRQSFQFKASDGTTYYSFFIYLDNYALGTDIQPGTFADSYQTLGTAVGVFNSPSTGVSVVHGALWNQGLRQGEITEDDNGKLHIFFDGKCVMQYDLKTKTFTNTPE